MLTLSQESCWRNSQSRDMSVTAVYGYRLSLAFSTAQTSPSPLATFFLTAVQKCQTFLLLMSVLFPLSAGDIDLNFAAFPKPRLQTWPCLHLPTHSALLWHGALPSAWSVCSLYSPYSFFALFLLGREGETGSHVALVGLELAI